MASSSSRGSMRFRGTRLSPEAAQAVATLTREFPDLSLDEIKKKLQESLYGIIREESRRIQRGRDFATRGTPRKGPVRSQVSRYAEARPTEIAGDAFLKDLLPLIARLEKGTLSINDLNYGYLSKVITNAIKRRAFDLRSEIWSGRELIESARSRIRKKRRKSADAVSPSTGLDQLLDAVRHNIDLNRVTDARLKLNDGRVGSGGSSGSEPLADDVADILASHELRAAVITAIANLADYDKEQHDVISRLYFHSGEITPTYASVAEDLDLTLKQVRKRHEDGLRYIEAELERQ
jgi:hypothetical protein